MIYILDKLTIVKFGIYLTAKLIFYIKLTVK